MTTESELINEIKNNPLVLHVSEPRKQNRNGLSVHQYQVLVGDSSGARLQNLQMAVVDEQNAYWIGSFQLPKYAGSKEKVIEHLYGLNPKPIGARERFSSYDKGNHFTIVDCYYSDGSCKSRLVSADENGSILSTELLEKYQESMV